MADCLLIPTATEPLAPLAPGLGYHRLAFFLEEHGFTCDIADLNLEPVDRFIKEVRQGQHAIVGIGVSNWRMIEDLEVLLALRKAAEESGREILFVGGGQEATMNYRQWLDLGLDIICLGFAEETLCEVVGRWKGRSTPRPPAHTLFGDMAGVSYIDAGGEKIFRPAPPIDEAWFQKFSYEQEKKMSIPYGKYWDVMRAQRLSELDATEFVFENVRLFTTSHCPMGCGFCSSQKFFPSAHSKGPILQLTAEQVFDLVVHHSEKYGAISYQFNDDNFLGGHPKGIERGIEFARMIIAAKQDGRLRPDAKFTCQTRVADFLIRGSTSKNPKPVNFELVEAMAAAGFFFVSLGIETFSDRLLRVPSVNKLGICRQDCCNVIDAFLEQGITPGVNVILGIPETTVDELIDTVDTAIHYLRKGCDVSASTRLMAIPGQPLLSRREYEVAYKTWINPENNQEITISDYIVPWDPKIAHLSSCLKAETDVEVDVLKRDHGWSGRQLSKTVRAISMFMAVFRILGFNDRYQALRDEVSSIRSA